MVSRKTADWTFVAMMIYAQGTCAAERSELYCKSGGCRICTLMTQHTRAQTARRAKRSSWFPRLSHTRAKWRIWWRFSSTVTREISGNWMTANGARAVERSVRKNNVSRTNVSKKNAKLNSTSHAHCPRIQIWTCWIVNMSPPLAVKKSLAVRVQALVPLPHHSEQLNIHPILHHSEQLNIYPNSRAIKWS